MNKEVIALRRALDIAIENLVVYEYGYNTLDGEQKAKEDAWKAHCLAQGEIYADKYIKTYEFLKPKIEQDYGKAQGYDKAKGVPCQIDYRVNLIRDTESGADTGKIVEVTPKGIDPGNWEKARRVSESMSRRFKRSVYDKIDEDLLDQEPELESNVIQLSEVIQQEGDATFFDPNETMYPEEEFDFAPLSKRLTIDSKASLKRKRPQLVADQENEE